MWKPGNATVMATPERDRQPVAGERLSHQRAVNATLPAGLEDPGRAEELGHGADVHPSGARVDHRHSAPGTMIPGGPHPAAESGEWERIRDVANRGPAGSRDHR